MKEQAYKDISDLVKRFEEQYASYKSGDYNETATRRDFIDPFFKALGWDIDNSQGAAEAYREVIHEDKVTVGEQKKSPDYSFRLPGGKRLFFVEAKKPSVFIKEEISPAYQIKRYAWSAKLPISILTDFEEFAVYDCTTKPKLTDKASLSRIKYLTFREYLAEFDFLWDTFAKENVIKGSFDKFVLSDKNKKGTATVDKEFLASLDEWRKLLAVDISKNNKKLDEGSINYAVQQTIDRIIFLRICEDRGIEPSERLKSYVADKHCYEALFEYFKEADKKYNSGLFDFKKDKLSQDLTIDDKVLKAIIRGLYYPECPFEFSVLPVEILGSAYEQFLGKVIRLTAGHNAKVEEKPEVRKAGGVYYTPQYIVEYIVKNTVGKLVEGKTPDEVEKIKIVDPACGSGSFLLGAYQFLLDWHILYYSGASKKNKAGCITPEGGLTTALKKKILLNNIYGVDLDAQAVEVTKLSLLLKCMEGETQASIQNQLSMFHERVLPTLEANIKCGNSLIGTDFFSGESMDLFGDVKHKSKINAFDWDGNDGFQEIMKSGGFDVVIGNPPYIRMETFKPVKSFLKENYAVHEERADLYAYFIEKGVSLLNQNGCFGMIVSNKFMKAKYGQPLRKLLEEKTQIITVADFAGADVFEGATVRTVIIIASTLGKGKKDTIQYLPVPSVDKIRALAAGQIDLASIQMDTVKFISSNALNESGWQLVSEDTTRLLSKIRTKAVELEAWLGRSVIFGTKTGLNEAFIIDQETYSKFVRKDPRSKEVLKPILFGKDIRRYSINFGKQWIIYLHPEKDIDSYPVIKEYMLPLRSALLKRATKQEWFELQQPAVALIGINKQAKIVYPIIANECRFCIDETGQFINDKAFVIPSSNLSLLGILNSRLAFCYFNSVCASLEGVKDKYLEFRAQYVNRFPLPIQFDKSETVSSINRFVEEILKLKKEESRLKTEHEQNVITRQILAVSIKIDKLVYELYGLTEDEIKIVEESSK